MSYRPHGRANVDPSAPVSFAICDRCGALYNITDLTWQFQWSGQVLQNLRLLVCDTCLDVPNPQLKPRILPPDPVPTMWARPEPFLIDDLDFINAQDEAIITTQDDTPLVEQNVANNREPAPE